MSRSRTTNPDHKLVNVNINGIKGAKGISAADDRPGFPGPVGGNRRSAAVIASYKKAIRQGRRRMMKEDLKRQKEEL